MAQFWLPGDSDFAKAAKGWPSSPNVKPQIAAKPSYANGLAQRFNSGAGFLISDFNQGNLISSGPELTINAGGSVDRGDLIGDGVNPTAEFTDQGNSLLWPRDTQSPGGYELTVALDVTLGPVDSGNPYYGLIGTDSAVNYWYVTSRYYDADVKWQLYIEGLNNIWTSGKIYDPNERLRIVLRSNAAGTETQMILNGAVVWTSTPEYVFYDRLGSQDWRIGGVHDIPNTTHRIHLAGFSQNDVGQAGAIALSRDMYCLLEPANDIPYPISVPAGGGAPTLSSPGVINVLSDRATPQVTLTF